MSSYSKSDVVLVPIPFTDFSAAKVRPAVVVGADGRSNDVILVGLTSRTTGFRDGEFVLADLAGTGLHLETAAKRAVWTIHRSLLKQRLGSLSARDAARLDDSLRLWLRL
jgi:mRNA interferase MazF